MQHLYNHLDLNFLKYESQFGSPGIKIISFHPMNFVFNSPSLEFMRNLKDSLSREDYNNISTPYIEKLRNKSDGIRNTVMEIINFVIQKKYPIMSMNEIYNKLVGN